MKKILLLSLGLFTICGFCSNAQAFQIVYPKSKMATTTADKTFFIGNETGGKVLKINNEVVPLHESGGFIYTVNLEVGNNDFVISNGAAKPVTYRIIRKQKPVSTGNTTVTNYKTPIFVETDGDNIPLRVTPLDFGANRLQHLPKNIVLTAVGEYKNFYKIQLSRDDFAWISKNNVKKASKPEQELASLSVISFDKNPESRIYKFKLDKKVPYIVFDNKGLDLTIYNVKGYPFNKYELRINNISPNLGFKSYYTSSNELVVETKNRLPKISKLKILDGLKITIDAGHGGEELGAVGCLGNPEKDINLSIAMLLKERLQKAGATVFMTREEDDYVSLADRVSFANKNSTDVFISIHNNAVADAQARNDISGTETYYFYPQSKELGKSIQAALVNNLNSQDGGVKQQSFAVVRNTECLSLLLEIGYMISPSDNAKLMDSDYQAKIADSIVEGLEKYFVNTKF